MANQDNVIDMIKYLDPSLFKLPEETILKQQTIRKLHSPFPRHPQVHALPAPRTLKPMSRAEMQDWMKNNRKKTHYGQKKSSSLNPFDDDYKYFNEASVNAKKDPLGRHVDGRYRGKSHKGTEMNDRMNSLILMMSAWEEFQKVYDIVTWIAHGTLLGWFWGGKMLPWDYDLDFQISYQHLINLIPLNQTIYENRYLFDINPHVMNRTIKQNNTNVIDARFIDTETGYYIDITALAYANINEAHLADQDVLKYIPTKTSRLFGKWLSGFTETSSGPVIDPPDYL
ncbi:hypothetical protein HDU76_005943, partial [Blyttiomyces sp. JEL0837]